MAQNVLFLCRTNSARSIIAEAVLNHLGGGHFRGHSAGNDPSGRVHALAIEQLNRDGCETGGLRSKSWTEFSTRGAPRIDYVITLCDVMAYEACPIFPGMPIGRSPIPRWPRARSTSSGARSTMRSRRSAGACSASRGCRSKASIGTS